MATQVVNLDNFVESDEDVEDALVSSVASLIHADGQTWPLHAGETVVGRGDAADMSLPEFSSLSGAHVRFGINAETQVCTVTDLGSTNGSQVAFPDGTIVKLQARIPEVLMEGSKVVLGVEEFEFKWTPDQHDAACTQNTTEVGMTTLPYQAPTLGTVVAAGAAADEVAHTAAPPNSESSAPPTQATAEFPPTVPYTGGDLPDVREAATDSDADSVASEELLVPAAPAPDGDADEAAAAAAAEKAEEEAAAAAAAKKAEEEAAAAAAAQKAEEEAAAAAAAKKAEEEAAAAAAAAAKQAEEEAAAAKPVAAASGGSSQDVEPALRLCITHIAVTKAISKIVSRLGGVLVDDPADADLLVTDALQRTIKFLCALSQTKYIVNELFLDDSGRLGKWVSMQEPGAQERYTLRDTAEEKKHGVTLPAILRRRSEVPFSVFGGWTVHVVASVNKASGPSQAQLLQLVAAGGGKAVKTKPPKNADGTHMLVAAAADKRSAAGVPDDVPVVLPGFVIESMFRLDLQWGRDDLVQRKPADSKGVQEGASAAAEVSAPRKAPSKTKRRAVKRAHSPVAADTAPSGTRAQDGRRRSKRTRND